MPNLKFIFFRTLLDWMSILHSLSLCSIIDLIDLCNLRNWLFDPQLYTPYVFRWHYFLISIRIFLLIKKEGGGEGEVEVVGSRRIGCMHYYYSLSFYVEIESKLMEFPFEMVNLIFFNKNLCKYTFLVFDN